GPSGTSGTSGRGATGGTREAHQVGAAPPPPRGVPVWLPAIAAAVLLLALVVGGGAPQGGVPGIPDPGPVTGWGLPLLRLAADLAAVAAVGLALAAAFLLPAPSAELRGERARDAG